MPQLRRSNDRRRRVLYQTQAGPSATVISNRSVEELRAARQPAAEFGSRVHRRLRGRWFSLVPVSGLAMASVAIALLTVPILLTICHHLAVTQPQLAFQESLARPLRIDRPDSFAAWWLSVILLLSAGVTWLIYQLRLHRNDDYRGHYRLWQLTLVVMLVSSVHAAVDLVSWLGAGLDLLVGDRAVLSGANWLRILLNIGGMILAMRLVAEVHRCRAALLLLITAVLLLGTAEAGKWNVYEVDSVARSTFIVAAPVLGFSCFLVGAIVYLRLLYRQVRKLGAPIGLRERFNQWLAELRTESESVEDDFLKNWEPIAPSGAAKAAIVSESPAPEGEAKADSPASGSQSTKNPNSETSSDTPNDPPRRRWSGFGWFGRKRKTKQDADEAIEAEDVSTRSDDERPASDKQSKSSTASQPQKKRKRGFSLRLRPKAADADAAANADTNPEAEDGEESKRKPAAVKTDEGNDSEAAEKKQRGGLLGRLLGRRKSEAKEETANEGTTESSRDASPLSKRRTQRSQSTKTATGNSAPDRDVPERDAPDEHEEPVNEDDIDWNSLSKPERRRLRKKLRRGNRAA